MPVPESLIFSRITSRGQRIIDSLGSIAFGRICGLTQHSVAVQVGRESAYSRSRSGPRHPDPRQAHGTVSQAGDRVDLRRASWASRSSGEMFGQFTAAHRTCGLAITGHRRSAQHRIVEASACPSGFLAASGMPVP